jgi:hypothetical protein
MSFIQSVHFIVTTEHGDRQRCSFSQSTQHFTGWHFRWLKLVFGRFRVLISVGTLAMMTQISRDFPQSLQTNTGTVPHWSHDRFLPRLSNALFSIRPTIRRCSLRSEILAASLNKQISETLLHNILTNFCHSIITELVDPILVIFSVRIWAIFNEIPWFYSISSGEC